MSHRNLTAEDLNEQFPDAGGAGWSQRLAVAQEAAQEAAQALRYKPEVYVAAAACKVTSNRVLGIESPPALLNLAAGDTSVVVAQATAARVEAAAAKTTSAVNPVTPAPAPTVPDLDTAAATLAAIRDVLSPEWLHGKVLPCYLGAENAARVAAIKRLLAQDAPQLTA